MVSAAQTSAGGLALARVIPLPGVTVTRTNVGVPGRLDHLAFDPVSRRLFVAALENGSLEVLDTKEGVRMRSIPGLSRPQGVAMVPGRRSVAAVACGGDGLLRIYDSRTLEERGSVEIGPDADNVRYDAASRTVLVSYGGTNDGAIAVLDSIDWRRLRDIRFKSKPESFQLEPKGRRLFANLPQGVRAVNDGEVAVADRFDGRLVSLAPLPGKARNFPMAYDAAQDRLFIATRRPARLIAIDATRNVVCSETPCGDDSDDLFYDPRARRVYVIAGGYRPDLQTPGERSPRSLAGEMGSIDVFAVGPGGALSPCGRLATAPHARTGLLVSSLRRLYVIVPMRGAAPPEVREYRLDD